MHPTVQSSLSSSTDYDVAQLVVQNDSSSVAGDITAIHTAVEGQLQRDGLLKSDADAVDADEEDGSSVRAVRLASGDVRSEPMLPIAPEIIDTTRVMVQPTTAPK